MRDEKRGAARSAPLVTGVERVFGDDEIIVSKTDLTGKLTYVNHVFAAISGYDEVELLGKPHSLIRHPRMPRVLFKLLWQRVQGGEEIFAFVLNRCKNGDEYWVFAHVTPTTSRGRITGYHSNRRTVNRAALLEVIALYDRLAAEERRHAIKAEAIAASERLLDETLRGRGQSYDELVWALENQPRPPAGPTGGARAPARGLGELRPPPARVVQR